jgi:hypothetical protein
VLGAELVSRVSCAGAILWKWTIVVSIVIQKDFAFNSYFLPG